MFQDICCKSLQYDFESVRLLELLLGIERCAFYKEEAIYRKAPYESFSSMDLVPLKKCTLATFIVSFKSLLEDHQRT